MLFPSSVSLITGVLLLQALPALSAILQARLQGVTAPGISPGGTCPAKQETCPRPIANIDSKDNPNGCCPEGSKCVTYKKVKGCCVDNGSPCTPDVECTYDTYHKCPKPYKFCCEHPEDCFFGGCRKSSSPPGAQPPSTNSQGGQPTPSGAAPPPSTPAPPAPPGAASPSPTSSSAGPAPPAPSTGAK